MNLETAAKHALHYAIKNGATDATCTAQMGTETSIKVRNGTFENVHTSLEGMNFALSVWIGQKTATVSGNQLDIKTIENLAETALALARAGMENPYALLAESDLWPTEIEKKIQHLDICQTLAPPDIRTLYEHASEIESAGMALPGITSSSGTHASCGKSTAYVLTSKGFEAQISGTHFGGYAGFISGEGAHMASDGFGRTVCHLEDLPRFSEIGREAARRTLSLTQPVAIKSGILPVIFDRRVSSRLLSWFFDAISGNRIYQKKSFLSQKHLGKQIFGSKVTILDLPHHPRGLRSRIWDNDGVATQNGIMVCDGELRMLALSLESAMKLGVKTTGQAGGPWNLVLSKTEIEKEELISDIPYGLLVTHILGHGPNPITGDYSSAVYGFLIENGEITRPVVEASIAGNLLEMFASLIPANDLYMVTGVDAPSVLIPKMTITGNS